MRKNKNFQELVNSAKNRSHRLNWWEWDLISENWRSLGEGFLVRFLPYLRWDLIIDDMKMDVARKYGMIHPHASDTRAVRAVFIIDTTGIIRAILYYPLTTGRNFDEILRILTALQVTDAFGVSTPADWMPGDDVVVPAPTTLREMNIRMRNKSKDVDVKSWYLTLRNLPVDEVWKKLKH